MPSDALARRRYRLSGVVQGVGFRPLVYRLASRLGLAGWVGNHAAGLTIEIEGSAACLAAFDTLLHQQTPDAAVIEHCAWQSLPPLRQPGFSIRASEARDPPSAAILPDLAPCPDCLREMNDPADRRYRYPFINCTACGPRYSILRALPYDRQRTTMADFALCPACRAEYLDPADRRFHAQPIACPDCGPQLQLWNASGEALAWGDQALMLAANAIGSGLIVALKGVAGFHLMADAGNPAAVAVLRARKQRKTKPLALMYSSLDEIERDCLLSPAEAGLLSSAAAPMVLLRRRPGARIAAEVAPGNPYLGVMLPAAPLQVLLLQATGAPLIATSANRAGEPVAIDNLRALHELGGIADRWLVHDRAIAHRADDSIVRVLADGATLLRRARGYAPLPLRLRQDAGAGILALGGHLKNTVALARGHQLIISPHLGDLDSPEACDAHQQAAQDLLTMHALLPERIAHDTHPDYRSTRLALSRFAQLPAIAVQHHYAHALSCMLDNQIEAPCLAIVWDGSGLGDDGSLWGGEFLLITPHGFERRAHFLPFALPGGEQALREPRRAALGVLHALALPATRLGFDAASERWLLRALKQGINAPLTSSVGRLFDAVASLCGLCQLNSFEGEAAMALEFVAGEEAPGYDFVLSGAQLDWRPTLRQLIADLDAACAPSILSARFHQTLTDMALAVALSLGVQQVLLSGGCFQNTRLLESTLNALRAAGFAAFHHQRIPANDGGLAAGQIMAALRAAPLGENNGCA